MSFFKIEEHTDVRYGAPFPNRRITDMPLFRKVHVMLRVIRTFAKHAAGCKTEQANEETILYIM
jgi:hypothetical protein